MIRIITDSTSDLSKELLERYRVNVLPLHVSLGEAEYRDGVDIAPDQLYAWADANKTTPKTSAPSLEDAVELFRPILQAGDEIIAFSQVAFKLFKYPKTSSIGAISFFIFAWTNLLIKYSYKEVNLAAKSGATSLSRELINS